MRNSLTYGLNNLFDYEILNPELIRSYLPYKKRCFNCDIESLIVKGEKCKNCPFVQHSNTGIIGCGKIFRPAGVKNPAEVGKHQILFFGFHKPELNFRLPPFPEVDFFGQTKYQKTFIWHFHHLNGYHWDDRYSNILLCLNTEHTFLQQFTPILSSYKKLHQMFDYRLKQLIV